MSNAFTADAQVSPLLLADRLIALAQDADRAGFRASATRLVTVAYAVLDDERPAFLVGGL